MNCYIVEGGIGKAIAFTSIVDALAEKDGGEICISTPYPDIFGGNPKIKWVFDSTTIPLTDQRIQDCKEDGICTEIIRLTIIDEDGSTTTIDIPIGTGGF